jgi:hypothetical protein
MSFQFVNIYVVESGDGYTSKPIAYFSSLAEAEIWFKSNDNGWNSISRDVLKGITVYGKTFLLGEQVDLDHADAKRKADLINAAKSKLTPDELQALIGK